MLSIGFLKLFYDLRMNSYCFSIFHQSFIVLDTAATTALIIANV